MTIAAGFWCDDGVLLCADTRMTGGIKLDKSKITEISIRDQINTVFAFAGDEYLCRMVIEECRDNLRAQMNDLSLQHFKAIVRESIKPIMDDYPNETVQLLIAVVLGQSLHLLATFDFAVKEVDTYECIGSGHAIAHYILEKSFKYHSTVEATRFRATCALMAAKEIDEPCGGNSQIVLIRRDGIVEFLAPRPTAFMEESVEKAQQVLAELLWTIFDPSMNDEGFKRNFAMVYQMLLYVREKFRTNRTALEMLLNLPAGTEEAENLGDFPDVISNPGSHGGGDA